MKDVLIAHAQDFSAGDEYFYIGAMLQKIDEEGREGSIINISVSYETMKRRGFSPYGPSKAALEATSAIWAQELSEARIRVNCLLLGGATNTGMVPKRTQKHYAL